MKKIFKQRGQAVIEFTLILPLFALVLFALIYLGFLFIDVVTLDSAAAAAARSAVQNGGEPTDAVKKKIKKTTLFLYWYEMDTNSPKRILDTEHPENNANFFTYGVQVKLKDSVKNNAVLKMVLPESYTVVKTAYKEYEEPEEP